MLLVPDDVDVGELRLFTLRHGSGGIRPGRVRGGGDEPASLPRHPLAQMWVVS